MVDDSESRRGLSSVLSADDVLCDFEKLEDFVFRQRFGEEGGDECKGEMGVGADGRL